MRRHYFVSCALAAGVLLMPAGPATAQDGMEDLDLENVPVITIYGRTFEESEPDEHAPVRIMGDHVHKEREVMLSYRYKRMKMDGNRDGTTDLSTDDVLDSWMVAPLRMTMEMHMFGAMHAISDKLTVMGMVNYLENDMDMKMTSGMTSSVKNSGLGDLKISGLYDLKTWDHDRRLHLNLGLSLPTGSIKEKDSSGSILGYPMQLGSGTWDLLPGITYLGQTGNLSYGAQFSGVLRIGENSRNYSLGENVSDRHRYRPPKYFPGSSDNA